MSKRLVWRKNPRYVPSSSGPSRSQSRPSQVIASRIWWIASSVERSRSVSSIRQERTPEVAGEEPVEQGRPRAADVEVPGGAGRKAHAHGLARRSHRKLILKEIDPASQGSGRSGPPSSIATAQWAAGSTWARRRRAASSGASRSVMARMGRERANARAPVRRMTAGASPTVGKPCRSGTRDSSWRTAAPRAVRQARICLRPNRDTRRVAVEHARQVRPRRQHRLERPLDPSERPL